MKNVLLCAYACSPVKGSEEGNGWNWATNLAYLGYNVYVITNTQDREEIESKVKELNFKNLNFFFIEIPFGLDSYLFNPSSKRVYFHYYFWRIEAEKFALKLNKTYNFDIVHHVTYGSLQQGTFLWKIKNAKLIFGPVGGGQTALPSLKKYFGKAWRTEKVRDFFTFLAFKFNTNLKKALINASHILATNNDTLELVKKTGLINANNIHLVFDNAVPPNMQDLPYFERQYSETINLLWVGRILPRKGLNLVLNSLSYLSSDVKYKLTIIGGGPLFDEIPKWIKEYNLDADKISILGQIPFEKVTEYYKNSDLFVFCSLRDSLPSQINEALAFGLPSVVLDIHGSSLAVPDDCGIKIKPLDSEETANNISKAIELLYRDRKLLKKMSQNAYTYSKNNTWHNKVKKVTELYY